MQRHVSIVKGMVVMRMPAGGGGGERREGGGGGGGNKDVEEGGGGRGTDGCTLKNSYPNCWLASPCQHWPLNLNFQSLFRIVLLIFFCIQ